MAVSTEVFHQLIKILEKITPLSVLFQQSLFNMVNEEHYKKGTHILNEREIQKRIWFIIKGSAREYRTDQNIHPQEQTMWFWFSGDFIYSVPGFFSQKPALNSIELLEDSHLVSLNIDDYLLIKADHNILEEVREHSEALRRQYEINKLHLSAKQRYCELFNAHPQLFNNAKQKDIAYFLGINPNSLSRLRRDN